VKFTELISTTNRLLAGEIFPLSEMQIHFDSVIDEINEKLDSKYPTITEHKNAEATKDLDYYDLFPDRYLRTVVAKGAAYKFYVMDEEAIDTAQKYGYEYRDALFRMERDYINDIPEIYQANSRASLDIDEYSRSYSTPFPFDIWRF